MTRPLRGVYAAGVLFTASALLVVIFSALYVAFAPRVYSSRARTLIRPGAASTAPISLQNLPRELFGQDRNVQIQNPKGSAVFDIIAFAPDPDQAALFANQRAQEFGDGVRARLNANFSLIEAALPNARPARPASRKIFITAGTVAINLGLAGLACLLVDFWKRRQAATNAAFLQPVT